jgi:hypothetical protein
LDIRDCFLRFFSWVACGFELSSDLPDNIDDGSPRVAELLNKVLKMINSSRKADEPSTKRDVLSEASPGFDF